MLRTAFATDPALQKVQLGGLQRPGTEPLRATSRASLAFVRGRRAVLYTGGDAEIAVAVLAGIRVVDEVIPAVVCCSGAIAAGPHFELSSQVLNLVKKLRPTVFETFRDTDFSSP